MTESPPPFAEKKSSFYHHAANYAVGALLGSFAINIILSGLPAVSRMLGGMLTLSAILAGIIALFGIRKHGSKGLLWKALVGILVPILLAALAIPAFLSVRRQSVAKVLRTMERQINAQAPKAIDRDTSIDGATVGPDGTITIRVKLVNVNGRDIDQTNWANKVRPALRKNLAQPELAGLVKGGATVIYLYFGKDKQVIDEITLRPEDYAKSTADTAKH